MTYTLGDLPTLVETVKLKRAGSKLEIEGRITMRSHAFLRYANTEVSINLQLSLEEVREIAKALTAIADFCEQDSEAA